MIPVIKLSKMLRHLTVFVSSVNHYDGYNTLPFIYFQKLKIFLSNSDLNMLVKQLIFVIRYQVSKEIICFNQLFICKSKSDLIIVLIL